MKSFFHRASDPPLWLPALLYCGGDRDHVSTQASCTFGRARVQNKMRCPLVLTPHRLQTNKFKDRLPQAEPAGDQLCRYMRLLVVNLDSNWVEVQQKTPTLKGFFFLFSFSANYISCWFMWSPILWRWYGKHYQAGIITSLSNLTNTSFNGRQSTNDASDGDLGVRTYWYWEISKPGRR